MTNWSVSWTPKIDLIGLIRFSGFSKETVFIISDIFIPCRHRLRQQATSFLQSPFKIGPGWSPLVNLTKCRRICMSSSGSSQQWQTGAVQRLQSWAWFFHWHQRWLGATRTGCWIFLLENCPSCFASISRGL